MNPTYDFENKVALVTGAASVMGLARARAFAEAGAAVVLADGDKEAVQSAAEELASAGHRAIGVVCDVPDESQTAAMVERAVTTFGCLDMAFNNTGVQVPPGDAADEPAENFDHVNAVNLSAAVEYAPRGIRIKAVCPGVIDTPMVRLRVRLLHRVLGVPLPGVAPSCDCLQGLGRGGEQESVGSAQLSLPERCDRLRAE
ncbi:SDR family NAD(P)-dependent oxidoreductase [Streptomyces sp. NPDC000618]|uniref:SDR family NAD(P)-dependent oxidoreductase n=1 Tax=Streptomyces sp. NPDC000618 TaxID=3154265 RepID=UPI00331B4D55